jgi:dipeptidyl-peptidase-4
VTIRRCQVVVVVAGLAAAIAPLGAQDRLKAMPGYEQYQRMQPQIAGSWTSGALTVRWQDTNSFVYASAGKTYRFDVATMKATESSDAEPTPAGRGARGAGRGTTPAAGQAAGRGRFGAEQAQAEMPASAIQGCPNLAAARGRQADCVVSPDGTRKAFYRDRNLWVANVDGSAERAVTHDGSDTARIKYGTASWVYGEELGQTSAIWWSPDSRKIAFYRFDESKVKDFYVQMNQTQVQDTMDVEAYPKAGAPNPVADVFVYDVASTTTTRIDARDGKPFDDAAVGHYVYNVRWLPDSSQLQLNRANRRQQVLELALCNPSTGKCGAIVHDEWLTGWINTDADPRMSPSVTPRWLSDGKRFIWESERSGWKNFYLYDISGRLVGPITHNDFESVSLVKVDEAAGVVFYTARDGDNYLKLQLHRVSLDGTGDMRLTDPSFTHAVGSCLAPGAAGCGISSDNKYFVDVYQRHDMAPATRLVDATGHVVAELARSDMTKFDQLGLKKAELFSYKAADGTTTLYGEISFPSNFDPAKKYPMLVPVYGGPVLPSNVATESFAAPNVTCEYGFLVVNVSYRGVPGTGKRGADALYMKLGQTEMDDMAEGVKALWTRPYVDKGRVGIYGTSYGGYTSAMQIVRHPEVFTAASASSPVTDWRHYDSIYSERYMWLPDENKDGYDAGSVMTYAKNLKGRLLLYYGTADNNVHQDNSMQLIRALQLAGKNFEVQVGPDQPHSGVNQQRMMEFFIENLVMHPERLLAQ